MKLPCVISLVSFSFVAVFAPWAAQAQVSTASVSGTVRDTRGSVIPGAEVALPNTETNVERDTVTNAAGAYAFLNVLPGTSDARD